MRDKELFLKLLDSDEFSGLTKAAKIEAIMTIMESEKEETTEEGFINALESLTEFAKTEDLTNYVIHISLKERIKYLTRWVERLESFDGEKFTYNCAINNGEGFHNE